MSDGNDKFYNFQKRSDDTATVTVGESLTVQADARDADINVIAERFGLTGMFPDNPRVPQFGDFDGVNDYLSARLAIQAADDAFMALPGNIRATFDNDPQRLLEFATTDENILMIGEIGYDAWLKRRVNPDTIVPGPVITPAPQAGDPPSK